MKTQTNTEAKIWNLAAQAAAAAKTAEKMGWVAAAARIRADAAEECRKMRRG